jgi:hypothetical protein
MTRRLSSLIIFLILTSPACAGVSRLVDYCPPDQDTHISVACAGIVKAAIAFTQKSHSANDQNFADVCVPHGTTAQDALRKIRPWLRSVGKICGGNCTPWSDALLALKVFYRCDGLNFMDH